AMSGRLRGRIQPLGDVGERQRSAGRLSSLLDQVQVLHEEVELHLCRELPARPIRGPRTSSILEVAAPVPRTSTTRPGSSPPRVAMVRASATLALLSATSRLATSFSSIAWPGAPMSTARGKTDWSTGRPRPQGGGAPPP